MNKTVKKVIIVFLILLLLLALYSCAALENKGEYTYRYKNFSPSVCPNTKWVCQEKELYFISDENGTVRGAGSIAGTEITFGVYFLTPADGSGFDVYTSFIGADGPGKATELWGDVYFEESKCILKYKAKNDPQSFWGDAEGTVTLTFLREPLPKPADFSGNG